MAAGYRKAVEWIALNDEDAVMGNIDDVLAASGLTIPLVADLFGKSEIAVAADVYHYRWKAAGRKAGWGPYMTG